MATVTYQWLNNSHIVEGQSTDELIFDVDRYDNGTYTCQVNISSPLLNSDITEQGSTTIEVTGIYLIKIIS